MKDAAYYAALAELAYAQALEEISRMLDERPQRVAPLPPSTSATRPVKCRPKRATTGERLSRWKEKRQANP